MRTSCACRLLTTLAAYAGDKSPNLAKEKTPLNGLQQRRGPFPLESSSEGVP
jgi:hypothetical protein